MYIEFYEEKLAKKLFLESLITQNKEKIVLLEDKIKMSKVDFNYDIKSQSIVTYTATVSNNSNFEVAFELAISKLEEQLEVYRQDNILHDTRLFLLKLELSDYENVYNSYFDDLEKSLFDKVTDAVKNKTKMKFEQNERRMLKKIESKLCEKLNLNLDNQDNLLKKN